MDASKPCAKAPTTHTQSGEKVVETFLGGGNIGCKDKTFSWDLIVDWFCAHICYHRDNTRKLYLNDLLEHLVDPSSMITAVCGSNVILVLYNTEKYYKGSAEQAEMLRYIIFLSYLLHPYVDAPTKR